MTVDRFHTSHIWKQNQLYLKTIVGFQHPRGKKGSVGKVLVQLGGGQCGQCGQCGVARKKMRDRQDLSPCQTREVASANVFLQFPSVSRIPHLLANLVTACGVWGGGCGIVGKMQKLPLLIYKLVVFSYCTCKTGKGHFSKWKWPFPHSRFGHFQCPKRKSKTTSQ